MSHSMLSAPTTSRSRAVRSWHGRSTPCFVSTRRTGRRTRSDWRRACAFTPMVARSPEAAWVAALRRDAGLAVPQVIPARDGSVVVWASADGVPGARSCVLVQWVRGRALREQLRADLVRKAGALTAAVPEHGAAYASERPAG